MWFFKLAATRESLTRLSLPNLMEQMCIDPLEKVSILRSDV
jgi:hypothetical protein